ncbi:acyl-CoA dehydrogenase family protein [Polymorphum gilvum]|uniref:Acyl-CoA dehydrogenase, putative n=1 Tax=Polymorphum gilvum (strain LMG 25793 / CGMCC 1.9160 / SL003B-26A1) TaxID=991905 RepID=F2J6U3_POLGS|nr:acyl-CoA dehydrogenase family protein [Polymorphum gilvum]ADZ72576.1 Acyl-CoA dehydrogenase, putative [Polymorphum gilvum SL003B-26A1]
MDFTVSPRIAELRERVRAFVADEILPLESDTTSYNEFENIRMDLRNQIRAKARAAGLWAPQMPQARGGLGLPMAEQAIFYEEANRSIFGPVCFNCAAPDDGNMRCLEMAASEEQKARWLQPIVDGAVNSSFVMTEPHPGGGSDPSMIATRAERHGNRWKVHGRKWFISGAAVASHFILIARTDPNPEEKRRQLTAFLFHRDQPGWRIVRRIGNMGPDEHGGVCELEFDGLEIDDSDRLMEIGDGLRLTQIRLGPARLTHCMRWLGLSKRCMEIAQDYVSTRTGFGIRLAERESVQLTLGEVAHAIQIGRLLVMHAAWKLDQGDRARKEVSSAKIHVADTLFKAVDTAIQLNGARGYSTDTILEWIYRYARAAKLVDGASEVHKMVLARFYGKEGSDYWQWG